ncbi:MAG: NYN domain-containing protein, partial [Alphaproteobacteria bacterium]
RSQPPMIADELRRQADVFIDLQDLAPTIQRNHVPREDGGRSAVHLENA